MGWPKGRKRGPGKANVKPPKKMTARQKLVVKFYFEENCVMSRAMVRAGYAKSTAGHMSTAYFKDPRVAAAIAERQAEIDQKYVLTDEFVTTRLMKIADANLGDILIKLRDNDYDLAALTQEERYAIAECNEEIEKVFESVVNETDDPKKEKLMRMVLSKFKIKVTDKKAALDSLARIRGMFKDKLEHTGGVSLADRIIQGRQQARAEKLLQEDKK